MSSVTKKSMLLDEIDADPKSRSTAGTSSESSRRTLIAIAGVTVSLLVLGYVVWGAYSSYRNDPRRAAWTPTLKDAETGEVFENFQVSRGENMPYRNPKTGKNSLYPVETCYWTKEGKAKLTPTYVILNSTLGKSGKTTCPDCGRSVVMYNPRPPDALMQQAWDAAESAKKR